MAQSPMLEYRIVESGSAFTETYLLDGELHREDGPAAIMRRTSDGRVAWETWYRHGKLHRQDGPAATYYSLETGRAEEAFYFLDGRLERNDGGPECVEFDPLTGRIRTASWWRNDQPQPLTLSRWLWLTRARSEGAP